MGQRSWQLTKEDTQMANKHMKKTKKNNNKKTSTLYVTGNCKLQQDATTYLSEWPKSKTLTTAGAGKNVKQ